MQYVGAGGVDQIVAAEGLRPWEVEGEGYVGRHAVLVVVAVESNGAGDGQAVAPTVGQVAHGGQAKTTAGGVTHKEHIVVGLRADGEDAGGTEAATVDQHYSRTGEESGVGRAVGSISCDQRGEVVVSGTRLDLTAVELLSMRRH